MTTTVQLSDEKYQEALQFNQQMAQSIIGEAESTISTNGFVFFAAFDGTNNDKNQPEDPYQTNVGQLWDQYQSARAGHSNLGGNYYAGVGTEGTLAFSTWFPPQVTQQIVITAQRAYDEFCDQASNWLANPENSGKSVTVALAAFSRGNASAAIFSQMLYEKGLIDPNDNNMLLIPPGQIGVSTGVLFDPVMTNVDGNLAFAPNVRNLIDIEALNEYRNLFKGADYRNHPGITTIGLYGNHCDIGGGYDNGIGSLSLQAATGFLQNSGLIISGVPSDRTYASNAFGIHSEQYDNNGQKIWDVTNEVGFSDTYFRDLVIVGTPASPGSQFTLYNGDKITVTDTGNGTETVARLKTNADGSTLKETTRYAWIGDASHPDKIVDRVTVEIGSDGTTANIKVVAYVGNHQIGISVPDGVTSAAIDVQAADGIDPATISTSIHSVDGTPTSIAKTGVGSDIYYAEVNDTIRDADGKGTVYLNGKQLSFATRKKGETTWTDSAGNTYALTNGRLEINDPLVIEGFDNGELGIYLDEEEDPDDPVKPPPYNPNSSTRFFSSPLALDLNDNGVIDDVSLANSTVYFDLTDDGIAEKTGWLAPGDGLLGMDVNGNGVIDDRGELFGTTPDLTAFDRMREVVDTNGDGFINANDPLFGALRVWQDANQDGISQAGELKTLDELGITSIDANATRIQEATANGNNLVATAGFTRNGELKTIVDIEFASNTALTNANPNRPLDLPPSLDSAVFQLPWLRGFGLVKSLPLAYQESPALQQAASDLIAQGWDGIVANFDGFMAKWTGLAAAHEARGVTRTYLTTEDKVWMLESLTGTDVRKSAIEAASFGAQSFPGLQVWDQAYITSQWQGFVQREAQAFAAQAMGKDWLKGVYYSLNQDRFVATDAVGLQASLLQRMNGATNGAVAAAAARVVAQLRLSGVALDLAALEDGLIDTPYKTVFQLVLDGVPSNGKVMVGDALANQLVGEGNADILDGGSGNDYLEGSAGNDIYVFGNGYGQDTVSDSDWGAGNVDTVRMAEGVVPGDVTLTRDYSNLYVSLNNGADRLTLQNWFSGDAYKIERLVFADGTIWNAAELSSRVVISPATEGADALFGNDVADTISGLGGNDQIAGLGGDDTLLGGEGNDNLHGGAGNDSLDGGADNDALDGGAGNDTNLFGRGDGQDTIASYDGNPTKQDAIQFKEGVVPADVLVSRYGDNLILKIAGTADQLTVQNYFSYEGSFNPYGVEAIRFADNTSWNYAAIKAKSLEATAGNDWLIGSGGDDALNGLAGDDRIEGRAGNDTLDGGSGNDALDAGVGNDTYLFGLGDGQDTIASYDGCATKQDAIQFKEGVAPADVLVSRYGDNLILKIAGTPDHLTVQNYFWNEGAQMSYAVEAIRFADDTSWDYAAIKAKSLEATAGNDWLIGGGGDDALNGLGGDDRLEGRAGVDVLDGGTGNDTLFGQEGHDTLNGGAGNDNLQGGVGNDSLDGGSGNDGLYGEAGNDTYVFGNGSGQDYVYDHDSTSGNIDTVRLATGIGAEQVTVTRDPSHLYLSLNNGTDRLTLSNWFSGNAYQIERVEFADGTAWGTEELLARIPGAKEGNDVLVGTTGDDTINGLAGDDTLYGLAGDDTLTGNAGNDNLLGGAGDDSLDGSSGNDGLFGEAGNDTYLFGNGSGQDYVSDYDSTAGNIDIVRLAAGIGPEHVTVTRDLYSLYLSLNNGADRLTLSNWFSGNAYQVERVEFADGTVWGAEELAARIPGATEGNDVLVGGAGDDAINGLGGIDTIYGQAGNDSLDGGGGDDALIGYVGNDVLDGGAGNDGLQGGAGNDTYLFGNGSGQDVIHDYDSTVGNFDMVRMATGVSAADVQVARDPSNLYLSLSGGADRLTLSNWFSGDAHKVEQVEFADGTTWSVHDLVAMTDHVGSEGYDFIRGHGRLFGLGGNDNLGGAEGNDLLDGGPGDDYLSGGPGSDTLDGGTGNDVMQGDEGDDVYLFGNGSGHDEIGEYDITVGNIDTVRFDDGVSAADVRITRYYSQLTLNLNDGTDTLRFSDGLIERVEFADGTVWNAADMRTMISFVVDENDNYLEGSSGNDVMDGLGGNDGLFGMAGADVLNGGAGNDYLDGGIGNDVYLFGYGSGQDMMYDYDATVGNIDTIRMAAGVTPDAVTATRDSTFYLRLNGSTDQLAIPDFFSNDPAFEIERVEFADGTVWNTADLRALISYVADENDNYLEGSTADDALDGLGGNDQLFGLEGNDTLNGGAGDDSLEGGFGDDIYLFGHGAGKDIATDWDSSPGNIDTIRMADDVTPDQVTFAIDNGNNLLLGLNQWADRLILNNWLYDDYRFERIEFADGTVWGADELLAAPPYLEGDDWLYGSPYQDDLLSGSGGNDFLAGYEGNDTLDGGTGNDTLEGGIGEDIYLFGNGYGQDTAIETDYSYDIDTVRLVGDVTPDQVVVTSDTGSIYLNLNDGADRLTLGNWYADEAVQIDRVEFGDGTVWSLRDFQNLPFGGTYGDDVLSGSEFDSSLMGFGGNDQLVGLTGNDTLDGGAGDDSLEGGAGDDTYKFSIGGGADTVVDAEGNDRVSFGVGIVASGVTASRSGSRVTLSVSATESISFDEIAPGQYAVESVAFADDSVWQASDIRQLVNSAPSGEVGAGGTATQGQILTASNTLADADGLGSIGYQWQTSADSGTTWSDIAGATSERLTLVEAQVGQQVRVTASYTDGHGTLETVASVATATINNLNDAPTGEVGAGGTAIEGQTLTASNTLADADGLGSIGYQWQSSGDAGATWSDIAGATSESFTLVEAQVGKQVRVTASYTDGHGTVESVASTATAMVINSNKAPTLAIGLTDQLATEDSLFTYVIPAGSFVDIDAGDALTYTATLGSGAALPSWLGFDAVTQTFSGIPTSTAAALLNVRVTASDNAGASISDDFVLDIANHIVGTGAIDALVGTALRDVIEGLAGNDTLNGGAGADTLIGGLGNDRYTIDNIGDMVVENPGEGTDTVQSSIVYTLGFDLEYLTLTGTAAINGTGNELNNALTGNAAANTLSGGAGNDTLSGGAGADTLVGGLGNDSYTVDNIGDVVVENSGEGTDIVNSSVAYGLSADVENLTLTGTAALNGTGNDLNNVLTGNAAANILSGGSGNDTLNGGTGADTLIGGLGNDSYTVDNIGDVVVENSGEGTDIVNSSVTYTLSADVENLTLTGTTGINGTGNALANVLTGNSGANVLVGDAGNDTLNGGTGADTLTGGLGDDVYFVDNAADAIVENAAEGTDTVQSSIAWTLGAALENLTLTGTAVINGTGNALNNVIAGNSAANVLAGLEGNDWLDGGSGNDTLVGGTGDDTYVVAQSADVVTENADEGTDTVRSSITWTLGANLENLVLTGASAINGTGNTLDNVITGNGANNTLNGGAGADTLIGGQGNDIYTVDNIGDVVIEIGREGTDTVNSSVTYTLSVDVEKLTLTGTTAINGTGNELDNVLTGNTGANTLSGGAGNDTLNGGTGADTMIGGTGDDSYTVDNAGDIVTEAADEGIDTVNSSTTHALGANVENLILTGTGSISGTGNAGDNVITGTTGNNTLTGNAGNDNLDGRGGTDVLVGGTGNDTYLFGAGYGSDTVRENDATAGIVDEARFLAGIAADQIWLRHVGNHLEASIIGTTDKLTLENWYLGSNYHVEQFKTADGKLLLDSQVENLVQAMAAFAPPAPGQTSLPTHYQEVLSPVIAANWQ
ncbi:calcium-binding protein [Sulfuritalea sp.]|uniref:calcium-binding protein n=1 Tax=Sulfuritalea sp. TaxID=2480090 RepID=UPI001AC78E7D|nr:calcium-binding protein [Sulfuritalea sp.]MBN8474837.1 DUF2235 domain-containing protein [Sulfuritalea sp.]